MKQYPSWPGHFARSIVLVLLLALHTSALVDTNQNGMSDLWERAYHGGQLLPPSFIPAGDNDHDGWSNEREAAAGTDPFKGVPPGGFINVDITYTAAVYCTPPEGGDPEILTPEAFITSWPVTPGKQYTLFCSPDLSPGSWCQIGEPIIESVAGHYAEVGVTPSQVGGGNPATLFWRVAIVDVDSDGDGLSDAEEFQLGIAPGFADANANCLPDAWEAANAGTFAVYPPFLATRLAQNQTSAQAAYLSNDTGSAVNYTVGISGNIVSGYFHMDSVTGSVGYMWEDISTTGTLLSVVSDADDSFEAVDITGFTFPFYGQNFTQVFVSSNGLLTFGQGSIAFSNSALPMATSPGNLIAALWDDLDPGSNGDIYCKQEADRLIIQYQDVSRYGYGDTCTFQVVLYADGRIQIRYQTVPTGISSCTVGIQNSSGTSWLDVVHDTAYLVNQMAIEIRPVSDFFTVAPLSGVVPAHSTATLSGLFQSLKLPAAVYYADLAVSHDGVGISPQPVTARLDVKNIPSTVALISPADGLIMPEGQSVEFSATASDPEGIARVEFYDGGTKIGEVAGNSYGYVVSNILQLGNRVFVARAVDVYGAITDSPAVHLTVVADTDRDGMPDAWELANGFSPTSPADALEDTDLDRYTNLEEYRFGKNPRFSDDSDSDGMPDGWEYHNGLNTTVNDAAGDLDHDGLTNLLEYQFVTNPNFFDTDGDLLPDGWEVQYNLDPLSAEGINGADGDPDVDGVTNINEVIYGSSPASGNTDGDATGDQTEINQGSDPNSATDGGQPPPAEDIAMVKLTVGDPSTSESERYNMIVTGVEGDTRTIKHQATEFGVVSTKSYKLRKGAKYSVEIVHTGTRPAFLQENGFSNYDWTADIQPDGVGVLLEPAVLIKKDPNTIFTTVIDWPNSTFQIAGKKADLFVMKFETVAAVDIPNVANSRKKLGVGEDAFIWVSPEGAGEINWTMSNHLDSMIDTERNYIPKVTMASLQCNPTVTADFGNGITHSITFQVVEPTGESATKDHDLSLIELNITEHEQGVGMLLNVTLLPDDVSFGKLQIKEISGPASNENGYFDKYKGGDRYHSANPAWLIVNRFNKTTDTAQFKQWPKILVNGTMQWIYGSFEWNIPGRWKIEGNPEHVLPNRVQIHTIHGSDGSSTEMKLARKADRPPTP